MGSHLSAIRMKWPNSSCPGTGSTQVPAQRGVGLGAGQGSDQYMLPGLQPIRPVAWGKDSTQESPGAAPPAPRCVACAGLCGWTGTEGRVRGGTSAIISKACPTKLNKARQQEGRVQRFFKGGGLPCEACEHWPAGKGCTAAYSYSTHSVSHHLAAFLFAAEPRPTLGVEGGLAQRGVADRVQLAGVASRQPGAFHLLCHKHLQAPRPVGSASRRLRRGTTWVGWLHGSGQLGDGS